MNRDDSESPERTEELRQELADARLKIQELEAELAETNEGMIALTLELEEAKDRYQKIFEASKDAILLIDVEQDAIHEANPQACELFGYSYETLLSFSPSEIFPDVTEHERFGTFADAVFQGWANGFRCRTNDGRSLQIEMTASTFKLNGRPLLLAAMRDVTQRKRREQRLQVLSRLFRHNLRNDGNVIQGHAEILREALRESDQQNSATTIKETIGRILGLSRKVRRIQDVLDREYISPVEYTDIVDDQRQKLQQMYPDAEICLNGPPEDVLVGQRLSTALYEAIENGIKHTDDATPTVVSADLTEDGERLVIAVRDQGPGIPQYERSTIDNREESPLEHGSGVGLWFIQWVISSLGGELSIEDNTPRGSILTMIVPVQTEDEKNSQRPLTDATIIQHSDDN